MKLSMTVTSQLMGLSPPTRGAWIEIQGRCSPSGAMIRRPPHGGRGLKLVGHPGSGKTTSVAPHTGGVD